MAENLILGLQHAKKATTPCFITSYPVVISALQGVRALFICLLFFGGFFACHGSFLFILLNHLTQLQQTPRTAMSLVFRCFAKLFFIPCESLEKSTTCWHFFLIGCVSRVLRQKHCDNECKCTNSMNNWTIIGASLGSSVNICLQLDVTASHGNGLNKCNNKDFLSKNNNNT